MYAELEFLLEEHGLRRYQTQNMNDIYYQCSKLIWLELEYSCLEHIPEELEKSK